VIGREICFLFWPTSLPRNGLLLDCEKRNRHDGRSLLNDISSRDSSIDCLLREDEIMNDSLEAPIHCHEIMDGAVRDADGRSPIHMIGLPRAFCPNLIAQHSQAVSPVRVVRLRRFRDRAVRRAMCSAARCFPAHSLEQTPAKLSAGLTTAPVYPLQFPQGERIGSSLIVVSRTAPRRTRKVAGLLRCRTFRPFCAFPFE
jgi:hypothetical protein